MPLFICHPAGAFRGETEDGGVLRCAGEDAVAGGEMSVEFGIGKIGGGLVEDMGRLDVFDGKAAQGVALVAPGVEIPVVAVVDEALGGDFAAGFGVAATAEITDGKALAAQHGIRHGLEISVGGRASGNAQDADAPRNLGLPEVLQGKNLPDLVAYRRQHVVEQSGLDAAQQLLRAHQGVEFPAIEPQAGQFEGVVAGLGVVIAVALPVVFDGGIEEQSHLPDNAVDGGAGAFQLFLDGAERHGIAVRLEDLVQLVDAPEAIHGVSPLRQEMEVDSVLQCPIFRKVIIPDRPRIPFAAMGCDFFSNG